MGISIVTLLSWLCLSLGLHTPIWHTDFEQAQAQSRTQDKPILMVFSGSDWCKPCIKLKREVFEQQAFIDHAPQHWVLLTVDFPRSRKHKLAPEQAQHNARLAQRYNPKGVFPLILILSNEGQIIGKSGYRPGGAVAYLRHLTSLTTASP